MTGQAVTVDRYKKDSISILCARESLFNHPMINILASFSNEV